MSSDAGCGCYGGCASSLTLEPHKRVHYAQGLVLGVDEFVQAEYYFLEGARRHHRMLHGHGTVCGLGVSVRDVAGRVEVRVEPGHAIDTRGREVRIAAAQCARLDDWLAREAAASPPLALGSPPEVALWVVLCYRECRTDLEPIPGTPCRTPDEAMTPTRVTESFSLRLDRERPDRAALDAIRAFARLIGRLEPGPVASPNLSIAELEAEIAALVPAASPPSPAAPTLPEAGPEAGPIRIPEDLVTDYLAAAFRTWVTVVRPALVPAGRGCADGPDGDGCIALARLRVPLAEGEAGLAVDGGAEAVAVEDADRPLLLSTQLLQELLLNGGATGAGGPRVHEELEGLDADDHRQYLLIEPRPPAGAPQSIDRLVDNLSGANQFRLRQLPNAADTGDAMPSGQPAGGDLSGSLPDPTVSGLHGFAVQRPQPADAGRHLAVGTRGGSLAWQLVDPPSGGGDPAGETGLVRLRGLSWMHNAPSDLTVTLVEASGSSRRVPGVAIGFGVERLGDARVLIGIDGARQRLDQGSLDIHSFRIYAEVRDDRLPSAQARLRLLPRDIIPVFPRIDDDESFFTEVEEVDSNAAPGALLVLDQDTHDQLLRQELLVWIEIDGDHVLALGNDDQASARAVDVEFLRSRLPTGDRPEGAERGTQGGLFSSWINRAEAAGLGGGRIDINRASFAVLRAAGLTATAARRLIEARETVSGFASFDDIRRVPSLSAAALSLLTDENRVYLGPR